MLLTVSLINMIVLRAIKRHKTGSTLQATQIQVGIKLEGLASHVYAAPPRVPKTRYINVQAHPIHRQKQGIA